MYPYIIGAVLGWTLCKLTTSLARAADAPEGLPVPLPSPVEPVLPLPDPETPGETVGVSSPLSAASQTLLDRLAHDPGSVSPAEIMQLQSELGVPVTGTMDEATTAALALSQSKVATADVSGGGLDPRELPTWDGRRDRGPRAMRRRELPRWEDPPRRGQGGGSPQHRPGTQTRSAN